MDSRRSTEVRDDERGEQRDQVRERIGGGKIWRTSRIGEEQHKNATRKLHAIEKTCRFVSEQGRMGCLIIHCELK